jgi:exonuclease SbcD
MRILHTSDWHLGRALCGERLLEDQFHVLGQVIRIVKEFRPHAVIVAGDVYDRAVPSPEAVEVLDDVVSQLVLDCNTDVILLAGNHDSGVRLSFGARVLARNRLHVVGSLRGGPAVIRLHDEWGEVSICAVPYTEPALAAYDLQCPSICDHDTTMRAALERFRFTPLSHRTVLAAHTFVSGAETSESERTLSVGGAGAVGLDALHGFSSVALGHLHRAQTVGSETVRYSGSLLKYAFSEERQTKQVNLISLDSAGRSSVEGAFLIPRRDVRTIQGKFDDLLRHDPGSNREDLISVILSDAQPILDARARLSQIFPNILQVHQPNFQRSSGELSESRNYTGMGEHDLFATFFQQVAGRELSAGEIQELDEALEAVCRAEREAVA